MSPEDSIFPSPFAAPDAVLNSLVGMGINIGTDFYVDRVYQRKMMHQAGFQSNDLTRSKFHRDALEDYRKVKPGATSTIPGMLDDNAALRDFVKGRINNELSGRAGTYGSRGTFTRRLLKAGPADPANRKWYHKMFNYVKTPEEMATEKGLRKAMQDIATGSRSASGALANLNGSVAGKALLGDIKDAFKFRKVGIAAINLGFGQLGWELMKGGLDSMASVGRASRSMTRSAMVQSGFVDSNMAYTTRQRAMRAIQMGQSGMQRALGNEAQYLRTVH